MSARRATLAAGGALVAYELCFYAVGTVHVWSHPVAGWLPLPIVALLSAYACREVSRHRALAAPIRGFWAKLAVALVLLAVATVSNAVDALRTDPPTRHLSLPTVGLYLAVCLVVLWSLLALPTWQRTRGDWARFGLDASTVFITSGVLIWHLSLRKLETTAMPVLVIVVISSVPAITLVKVALAGAGRLDRRALHLLSAGTALAIGGGLLTPLFPDRQYLSAAFVAIPVAVFAWQLAAARQMRAAAGPPPAPRARSRFSVLPYLAVLGMDGLLLGAGILHGREGWIIGISLVAIGALVVARQISALRENGRLLTTVDANLAEMRRYQARLDHQVTHDALTGIANRVALEERITARLAAGETFHLALLDLDDFKEVNDRRGHGVGDALLQALSTRLHQGIRGGRDLVARLGGDEFALLLPVAGAAEADVLLRRLVDGAQQPMTLAGQDLTPRISVGVTICRDGDTPQELIRRADVAMYAAKAAGGGRWAWFDSVMDEVAGAEARIGADLRQAIARDELFVLYQPIVELPHGRIVSAEALLRWQHPELGLVSPAVFIPIAERNGSIVELGRWVLERVFEQTKTWERAYGDRAPRKVSVNISARQLHEPGFAAEVTALLERIGLAPSRVTAEVTETAVLGTGAALDTVRELHERGLAVALDDFGTGQSSLSLLVTTPVSVLKVDKSFVDGVTERSGQAVIVEQLIGITEGLRIEAVAEGVETADQARRLHEVGYKYAQGFHFARPMPPDQLAHALETADTPAHS